MTVPVTPQGGEPAAAAATTPAPQVVVGRKETDAFILRLIAKHGSTENALTQLAGEQLRYRKRAQNAETERDTFKAKVPAAGAVVLDGDEAKAYEAIKKAGIALDKVPEMMTSLKDLQSKDSKMSRESAITLAAGEKYKPKVLKKLLDGVDLEFKKVNVKVKNEETGKDDIEEQQVPFIATKDADGKKTLEALDTYLEREHDDWMDVLKADETDETTTPRDATKTTRDASSTVTVPRQTSTISTKPPKGGEIAVTVDKTLAGKYLSPSQRNKANEKT